MKGISENKTNFFPKLYSVKGEVFLYILIAILLAFITYKYVSYGDVYEFETPWTEEKVSLNENVILQEIIIDEKAQWDSSSYGIYLYLENGVIGGYIDISLIQNDVILENYRLNADSIQTGWNTLNLQYAKLSPGTASMKLFGVGLEHEVYAGICENTYNIPNCFINGQDSGYTLVQRYHYNFRHFEYKLRCIAFFVLVLMNLLSIYVVWKKEDDRKSSIIVRSCLTISYMCLVYIYNGSLYLNPTWCETVTNFMDNAINKNLGENLLISDAGYLPLFQRLITLAIFKGLHFSVYYGLYSMQITAYVLSGWIVSFFAKQQFSDYLDIKYRYALCLLFMMQMVNISTGAFINFMYYGIFTIFLYYLVDSSKWNRFEFTILCLSGCFVCLSKGYYVTTLPLMFVCFVLFFKNYSLRDKIFSVACASGALLQLIYYFSYGSNWIDRSGNAGQKQYYIKLVLQPLVDVPNHFLALFQENITFFNGISFFIIIIFWAVIFCLFAKYIMRPYFASKTVTRNAQVLFMMFFYLFMQSVLLRSTVLGVNSYDIGDFAFWDFSYIDGTQRYHISFTMAVIIIFIISAKVLRQVGIKDVQQKLTLALTICLMLGSPRFQLQGIGTDIYTSKRPNLPDTVAETILFKEMEDINCRVVPIWWPNDNGSSYLYKQNAQVYCIGSDVFGWKWAGVTCLDSEKPAAGKLLLTELNVNTSCDIWQIFIKKKNLIARDYYQI